MVENIIQFSPKESKRFGLKTWRVNMSVVDSDCINELIKEEKPDIIILRLPSEQTTESYKLLGENRQVLHCDTLVYYFCPLSSTVVLPFRNNLKFNLVTRQTQYLVNELTEEIFKNYKSHYAANPLLKKEDVLQGYKEWTASFINEINSDKYSWYITKDEKIIGFAVCSILDEANCEGVFSGVKAAYSGRGVYSDIVRFLQTFFKSKGMRTMKVSTQIQNYSVQKTWIREGFTLKQAYDTWHINCFHK
jgi:ribosomal protein S18 acetylase RimI-like enzyme